MESSGLRISDAGLDDESSLTGMVFFICISDWIGTRLFFDLWSCLCWDYIYVFCCDCIFRLCLSGVIAGGWCTSVYTDWSSWALCYLGLIHSHSSQKGVRIFWVEFGLSEMNCARGICSVMLVRQPWLLWNTSSCEPVRWYSKIRDPGKWYLKIRESGRTYFRICIFENLVCHACETIMTYIQCVNLRNWILELRNCDFRYCIDFVICISAFSWLCDLVVEELEWIACLWFREFGMSCLWDNHNLHAVNEVVNFEKV